MKMHPLFAEVLIPNEPKPETKCLCEKHYCIALGCEELICDCFEHKCILDCGCPLDGDDRCEKCCDHDDICMDERICLICGSDQTENLASMAEDYGDMER